ncbi:MAG: AAA family ATPase, partial [Pseudonocardiaceae bacterium]
RNQQLMRFNETLTEVIKADLEMGIPPALMGEPGIGKSSWVESLAYEMGTKAFVLPCNQLADKADLTGARLVPTEDGGSFQQVFFPHHVIAECIGYAEANPREWPILFLDEINRTTADVTSGALTLVTLRRMGHVKLPDNVRIMVAGNDKGNVTSLDEASLSRFSIYRVEPEAATLIEVLGDDINPWVKEVLVRFPGLVFQKATPSVIAVDGDDDSDEDTSTFVDLFDSGEEMNQLTTPRTIENLSRWLNKADPDQLGRYLATPSVVAGRETTVLNEIIEAHVGNTEFAVQVVAKIADDLASGMSNTAGPRVTVPQPNCYASLKAATTVTDLEGLISTLTDNEKSGCLLFALKENADNTVVIEQLAQATDNIESTHLQTLVQMLPAGQVDQQNLEALLNSSAPIVDSLRSILSAFQ